MGKLNYISGKRCLVRFVIRTLETVAVSGGLGNRESGRGDNAFSPNPPKSFSHRRSLAPVFCAF